MNDIILNKPDLLNDHSHHIIFFNIINIIKENKENKENNILSDECNNLNTYIFEDEEFEISNFEIKNNFIIIKSHNIDVLYYIETNKKIKKVYTLFDNYIINEMDLNEIICINNKYYFNNINKSNGIFMKYFDSCTVIILFDDVFIKNEFKIVYKKFKIISEINMFIILMKNYNMRKLYGIPYQSKTLNKLKKLIY